MFHSMERYGVCKSCLGLGDKNNHECGTCGGTGFSGDAMDYLYPEQSLRINTRLGYQQSVKSMPYASLIEIAISAMVPPKNFGRR
jgi:hypothetical protein